MEFQQNAQNVGQVIPVMDREWVLKDLEAILDIMEIKHLSNKYPHELSGGESQKTAIARALVKEPEIILADEPTASLDSSSRKEILCLLKNLTHQGIAIVLVSHDKEAVQYADRVIKL